jgi:hypothetical protein
MVRSASNHSIIHITREIYTHVTSPRQSDVADRVARVILGPTS